MAPVMTREDQQSKLEPSLSELELGAIKQARRRQRRRRLAVVLAALAAGLVVVTIGSGGGGQSTRPTGLPSQPGAGVASITPPAPVFAQDPYMGVACDTPNSIACDRVGLAVWLRRPAIVTATIAGAPLTLNDRTWSWAAHDSRGALYVYSGFLQPAGLTTRLHVIPEAKRSTWAPNADTSTWLGTNNPDPFVRFRIDYGPGDIVFTQKHVWLSAGWG
jgi:hypothetical protein